MTDVLSACGLVVDELVEPQACRTVAHHFAYSNEKLMAPQFNTQIDVIGNRASGEGSNINTDLSVGKGDGTRSDIDVRIDGQVDIDTRGGLSDAIRKVGKGAGRVASSTGGMIPSDPPVIIIKPRKSR